MKIKALFALLLVISLGGCDVSVNEDVVIPAGSKSSSGATSVNGNIVVGAEATADGSVKTVNGRITVEDGATVKDIASVNGSISVGERAHTGSIEGVNSPTNCEKNARVDGDIKLVNGEVNVRSGATVAGNIKTVNGPIRLTGATVDGNVGNYNGGIVITDNSTVKGDVTVYKPSGQEIAEPAVVVIGPGSTVLGKLSFERPVKLYVHELAQVDAARIHGADPISYSGTELPEDG